MKTVQDFFDKVKPPYFEDYTIQIVPGTENCFSGAAITYAYLLLMALSLLFLSI